MAAAEETIKKALANLKATISAEDACMFSNTSLRDLCDEAHKIEEEQGARYDLRNMRRVEPFLQCLESYAGVIEVFCQAHAPMAFVWVDFIAPLHSLVSLTDKSLRVRSN